MLTKHPPTDSAFKKAVMLKCYDALEAAGFARFRKEAVDWPLGDGFHAWVGLNTGLAKSYLDINPFVGVHVVPIDKLSAVKEGRYPTKYDRHTATYALHMGEIAGNERAFRITRESDVDAEAARLARLYVDFGLPFARSIASYDKLLPLLQERAPMLGGYPQRVAACLYLMGRKEEARAFIDAVLQQRGECFEDFAAQFLRLLATEKD